jgi:hypothetical protein
MDTNVSNSSNRKMEAASARAIADTRVRFGARAIPSARGIPSWALTASAWSMRRASSASLSLSATTIIPSSFPCALRQDGSLFALYYRFGRRGRLFCFGPHREKGFGSYGKNNMYLLESLQFCFHFLLNTSWVLCCSRLSELYSPLKTC